MKLLLDFFDTDLSIRYGFIFSENACGIDLTNRDDDFMLSQAYNEALHDINFYKGTSFEDERNYICDSLNYLTGPINLQKLIINYMENYRECRRNWQDQF